MDPQKMQQNLPHPPDNLSPEEQRANQLQYHKNKLPPLIKYPHGEQNRSAATPQRPVIQFSLLRQSGCDSNTWKKKGRSFQTPDDLFSIIQKDRYGPTTQILQQIDFPLGAYMPKVQLSFSLFRKIEIEKQRREYQKLHIAQLLDDLGIGCQLVPTTTSTGAQLDIPCLSCPTTPVVKYLPLELFDNEEFECRTPKDWLALGCEQDSSDQKPVPAKAFLPTHNTMSAEKQKTSTFEYTWQSVGVLDYSPEKKRFLVQKADPSGRVRDGMGKPVLGGSQAQEGRLQSNQYWVPRIRLQFCAEDPRIFAQRVHFACRARDKAEALQRYHFSVVCKPSWSGTPTLPLTSLQRIKTITLNTPRLQFPHLQQCVDHLEKEIQLEYARTMNQMIFDKMLKANPEEFSEISLPEKEPETVPKKGSVSVPYYPFVKNRDKFTALSLLTKPEVISALSTIQAECNRVEAMSLFHVTLNKPLRLEEFGLMQSQMHTQVQLFLRDTWFTNLCYAIHSSLCDAGPGWYNLNESSWQLYSMSKLCRLMTQIRYKLQDSLRFLVHYSLTSLVQLVLDACHSVLHCPPELTWDSDLIHSPYKPKKNPLFLVDLILDQTGVHYSTSLEKIKTSVIDLLSKGILCTHNLPQLDKFVMKNLFISGEPLLESVCLWEPAVIEMSERISNALHQATIPLQAYAREYECYFELHNSDISTLLKLYSQENITPLKLKEEVMKHLQEKEILERSLPSAIVIGPFMVNVEPMKKSLSKKCQALANAVIDHLALTFPHVRAQDDQLEAV